MVRDELMQQVIRRNQEPITPFLERARDLYEKDGISTILVAGSSGAFFYIADTILQMDSYRPLDITDAVKTLCRTHAAPRTQAPDYALPSFERRLPAAGNQGRGRGPRGAEDGRRGERNGRKIKTMGKDAFSIDRETVDLRFVEQLADPEQTSALAYLLRFGLDQVIDGRKTVRQTADQIWNTLEQKGWEPFCGSYVPCGLAKPRRQELFACLNRWRG